MQEDFMQNAFQNGGKKRTIVLTGAGISQSAGIPTFDEFPELREVLTLEYFNKNFKEFWTEVIKLQKSVAGKRPTMAHTLLANQRDWRIVTMNIDSLHQKARTKNLLEVHGNLEKVACTHCSREFSFANVFESLYCPKCGGKLRPKVVLYGDKDVPGYKTAMQDIKLYSTVIIIGTSFKTNFADQFRFAAEALKKEIHIFNRNADEQLTDYLTDLECSF